MGRIDREEGVRLLGMAGRRRREEAMAEGPMVRGTVRTVRMVAEATEAGQEDQEDQVVREAPEDMEAHKAVTAKRHRTATASVVADGEIKVSIKVRIIIKAKGKEGTVGKGGDDLKERGKAWNRRGHCISKYSCINRHNVTTLHLLHLFLSPNLMFGQQLIISASPEPAEEGDKEDSPCWGYRC